MKETRVIWEFMRRKKIVFRMSYITVLFLFSIMVNCLAQGTGQKSPNLKTYPAYSLLDKLIQTPKQIRVHQVSSHNKQGYNSDENWCLYEDKNGDKVIFDAVGPGCIRSMWVTYFHPDAIIKFYFDGEEKPRYSMNYIDFYKGKHKDFPSPLLSYEKRGYCCIEEPCAGNSFLPIPYKKSLKIAIQGLSRFFHIIYEEYPAGTPVRTFSGKESNEALVDCLKRFGDAPIDTVGMEKYVAACEEIAPSQKISLLKLEKTAGIIRRIDIDADGSVDFFQNTRIRMRWDGHHRWDINAPIGIFFGSAVEADEMRSLPLRVEKLETGRVRLHCYFPMPFWENAEIELVNLSHQQKGPLEAEIYVSQNSVEQANGTYFTAMYHEGETIYSHDWLLFEGMGSGWFVGVVQSMKNGHYCEGDERFYIDGAISPQINGTGTEDYYLACFWSNLDFDTPFGCVVGDILKKGGGDWRGTYYVPSCYSRYHLEAPIPFYSSINARIQHGGLSNIRSDYRSLAFCYLNKRQRIHQTDFIDVGNPASEAAHEYRCSNSDSVVNVAAYPEGEYFEVLNEDKGRYHKKGDIAFKIAIDPDNHGVRLRRRIDQKIPHQKAEVYIDGKFVGCWYHSYQNEHLRWFDSDFEIHPDYTKGKNILNVKLVVVPGEHGMFTDFKYEVHCYFQ